MSGRPAGDRLVMSPMEPLVAGGAAEAFERQLQQLDRTGYRHLVVDLSGVPAIDSAGIRTFGAILFLLMGLGRSAGLGAFAVSVLGTAFPCVALLCLDRMSTQKARAMSVEILAAGRQFPATHVEHVCARNQIVFEPREISQSDDMTVKYHTWLDPRTSLDDLSVELMTEGAGVRERG